MKRRVSRNLNLQKAAHPHPPPPFQEPVLVGGHSCDSPLLLRSSKSSQVRAGYSPQELSAAQSTVGTIRRATEQKTMTLIWRGPARKIMVYDSKFENPIKAGEVTS